MKKLIKQKYKTAKTQNMSINVYNYWPNLKEKKILASLNSQIFKQILKYQNILVFKIIFYLHKHHYLYQISKLKRIIILYRCIIWRRRNSKNMERLSEMTKATEMRLWGKILCSKRNYYVVEAVTTSLNADKLPANCELREKVLTLILTS